MDEKEKHLLKVNILEFLNGNTYKNNKNRSYVDILMHVKSLYVARPDSINPDLLRDVLQEMVNEDVLKMFKVGSIDTYAITSMGKEFLKKLYDA